MYSGDNKCEVYKAVFGFDGYIDSIYSAIQSRDKAGVCRPYPSKNAFAADIGKLSRSCDVELSLIARKEGGNAPIAARALAALGIDTCCIGTVGDKYLYSLFASHHPRLTYFPIGNPAETISLEFSDSKIMLADVSSLHKLSWENMIERLSAAKLQAIYNNASLVGLMNWSVSNSMDTLWRSLRQHILTSRTKTNKKVFFDLADPLRRTDKELKNCISLIEDYALGYTVTLGLNLNEAERLCAVFGISQPPVEKSAAAIFSRLRVDAVVVHNSQLCVCATAAGTAQITPQPVKEIALLTGAGDAFNAGYCFGWLRGLSPRDSLETGCAVANRYITTGTAPSAMDLNFHY